MHTGLFIALEGIDGSGKTTLRTSISLWLKEKTGQDVFIGWEPKHEDQGVWAKAIRGMLRGVSQPPSDPLEFQRLYLFDRAEDIHFTILPELKKNNIVLYDRYALSTLAYGMLSGIPIDRLISLHNEVIGSAMLWPTINIILDIDPSVALSRKSKQYETPEFFEKAEALKKIQDAYLAVAEHPQFKKSTFIIAADQSLDKIEDEIKKILEAYL